MHARIVASALATVLASLPAWLHAAPVDPTCFVTTDGVRLQIIEAGQASPDRPVVAFVPGWSMPASIWTPQLEAISKTHKVAALDPRGQGGSEIAAGGWTTERRAEDLHEFVSRYAPVVLVTWSLGALEALQYLHDHGDGDIRALVIVDSSVGEGPAPAPRAPGDYNLQDELRRNRAGTVNGFVRGMFRKPQPETLLAALRDSALRMPLEASLSIFPADRIPRERWRDTVNEFTRPLLYVVTPQFAGQARSLKAKRPLTQVEVFRDAGHALFVDEPERFSALLADFLRRNWLAPAAVD